MCLFLFFFNFVLFYFFFFFFFQAEDGIRDWSVTGVQTCALPISTPSSRASTANGVWRFSEVVTVLWFITGILAAFAVAEQAGRRWLRCRREYYVFPPGQRVRMHIDRETLPELEPVVRLEINSWGERGDEVPRVERGERLYRVLVTGGSQPEGHFLDQHTTWPGALQRALATPDRLGQLGASRAHVGSIARSGVGAE